MATSEVADYESAPSSSSRKRPVAAESSSRKRTVAELPETATNKRSAVEKRERARAWQTLIIKRKKSYIVTTSGGSRGGPMGAGPPPAPAGRAPRLMTTNCERSELPSLFNARIFYIYIYVTVHAKTYRKSAKNIFEIRADFASPIYILDFLQNLCG